MRPGKVDVNGKVVLLAKNSLQWVRSERRVTVEDLSPKRTYLLKLSPVKAEGRSVPVLVAAQSGAGRAAMVGGMERVADAHLHFFSSGVFRFYAKQAPSLQDAQDKLAAAAEALGVEAPPERDEDLAGQWVRELDRHQVSRAVLLGSAPGEQAG